jgi:signal transduction histidine kinase
MFELFERGDLDPAKSAGVGLALVRKSVERMQGRLWVESSPGCGSKFWLEFKAA